eukprot:5904289-Pyramimonas_sp.AAC.1
MSTPPQSSMRSQTCIHNSDQAERAEQQCSWPRTYTPSCTNDESVYMIVPGAQCCRARRNARNSA